MVASRLQIPSLIQPRKWVSASSSAHAPMGTIVPVSSAMGMNSAGEMMLPSSRVQRMRASKPTTSPSSMSTIGWWTKRNSLRSSALYSAVSTAKRWVTRSSIDSSNMATQFRPASLARYIAVSACRSRSSAPDEICFWNVATPMLVDTKTSPCRSESGSLKLSRILSATIIASLAPRVPGSKITNSSPEILPTTQRSGSALRNRCATAMRTLSPA